MAPTTTGGLRAVFFDFDGVLVNSEGLKAAAHVAGAAAMGLGVSPERYRFVIGGSHAEVALEFAGDVYRSDPDAYDRAYYDTIDRLWPSLTALAPGAGEIAAALRTQGIPLALVTSNTRERVEDVLRRSRTGSLFDVVVTAEDVPRAKPDPEPYLEAARRLGLRSVGGVCLEDSAPGVQAARAAGLRVIGVEHALNTPAALTGAEFVVQSLRDTAGVLTVIRCLWEDPVE